MKTAATTSRPSVSLLVAVAAAVCLAGCGAPAVDKQGAPANSPTVLTIGAVDQGDPELAFFVDTLDKTSQHRLRAEIDRVTYYSETPRGEAKLADAVRTGAVGLAYLPSRDWAATGDPGFRAVQTPFLVSTTAATIELSRSPVTTQLLAGMEPAGVHGLALIPGEARRLLSREPVTSIVDLAGKKIRISDSQQSQQMFTRLGASPVQGLVAAQTRTGLTDKTLDAVETSPTPIRENTYNSQAPYLTSFGLFPKLEILAASGAAWNRLDAQDKAAVQDAATQTLGYAATAVPTEEAKTLSLLCTNRTVLVKPTDDALHAMASAAAAADPQTAAVVAQITAAVPGTGPQPDAGPIPQECHVAGSAAEAEALAAGASGSESDASSQAFPPGTYTVTLTPQELAAGGVTGPDWSVPVTYTWTFQPDGTLKETQSPDFPDQGPVTGTWKATGDQLHLVFTESSDPSTTYDETTRWSYFQGELRFVVVAVQDDGSRVMYGQPWRKAA